MKCRVSKFVDPVSDHTGIQSENFGNPVVGTMNQVGIDNPYPLTNTTFKPMFNSLYTLVSRRFGHFLNRKKFARAFHVFLYFFFQPREWRSE
jgi:hypothetical protein